MWSGAILGSTYYRWGHQQACKKQNWKRATLMVVAGPAESNYERGLKMASCNDERRWVKRWRKGSHCIVITSFLLLHPSYQDEESKLKLL